MPGVDKSDIQIEAIDYHTLVLKGRCYSTRGHPEVLILKKEGADFVIGNTAIDQGDGVVPTGAEKEERFKVSEIMRSAHQKALRGTEEAKKKNEEVREEEKEGEGGLDDSATYWHAERTVGQFQRVFTLPSPVDPILIEATYKNGLLSILAPKVEKSGIKRTIQVREL